MWIAAQYISEKLHIHVQDGENVHFNSAEMTHGAGFEDTLLSLAAPFLRDGLVTPVICAGVGDVSFAQVPCSVPDLRKIASHDARIQVFAMPRLAQVNPVDVLRGEEAMLAGFLDEVPEWDGVVCLTGSCSRWVHISAGEVISFRSFLTGEVLDWLIQHSSLRAVTTAQGWDAAAFDEGLADAMSRPERFASLLASLTAGALLDRTANATSKARLSGTLIGMELAATRPYWLGRNVAVIGDGTAPDHYAAALKAQGVPVVVHEGNRLALSGLRAAYVAMQGA